MGETADELTGTLLAMSKLTGDPEALLKRIDEGRDSKDDHMLYVLKGLMLTKLKRYEDAEKAFNTAIKINPRSGWAQYRKGEMYFDMGENEKALGCFEKACDLKPNNGDFWVHKGLVEYELNRFKEAYESFERGIHRGDKTGWGWFGKSRVLVILNLLEDALDAVRIAADINPNDGAFIEQERLILGRLQSG